MFLPTDHYYPLDMEWEITQVDFVNDTGASVPIDVFNSNILTNYNTDSGSVGFYISSPYNYNALVRDIEANPMMIRRIELITENANQLAIPINVLTRDANGNQAIIPRFPLVELSANQYQPFMAYIDFRPNELILNNNTIFSEYTFLRRSTTRMVIYYKQITLLDVVTGGLRHCMEIESCGGFRNISFTEQYLLDKSTYPKLLSKEQVDYLQKIRS